MSRQLKDRWVGQPVEIDVPSSFGITAEGLQDFRGVPLGTPEFNRPIDGVSVDGSDFSGASFQRLRISNSWFTNCTFGRTDMTGLADLGNRFENCQFIETDMRAAGLGFNHSSYKNCVFDRVRFQRVSFINAIFENVTFRGNLKRINFKASGFWGCKFIGSLWDIMFSGADIFDEQQKEIFGLPKCVGLHDVSFEYARLAFVGVRWNCPITNIRLPRDESSILYTFDDFVEIDSQIRILGEQNGNAELDQFLRLQKVNFEFQSLNFLNEQDAIDICGSDLGRKVYKLAKNTVRTQAKEV